MTNQEIIEEEFEKIIEEVGMNGEDNLKEIVKYFYVEGLRVASKLKDE